MSLGTEVWLSLGLLHYVYILGALAPDRISPRAKFTSRPSLALSYIGSVTALQSNQTLRRGTGNGIMELSQRAPSIFGWAAVTMGIGPHSSFNTVLLTHLNVCSR